MSCYIPSYTYGLNLCYTAWQENSYIPHGQRRFRTIAAGLFGLCAQVPKTSIWNLFVPMAMSHCWLHASLHGHSDPYMNQGCFEMMSILSKNLPEMNRSAIKTKVRLILISADRLKSVWEILQPLWLHLSIRWISHTLSSRSYGGILLMLVSAAEMGGQHPSQTSSLQCHSVLHLWLFCLYSRGSYHNAMDGCWVEEFLPIAEGSNFYC